MKNFKQDKFGRIQKESSFKANSSTSGAFWYATDALAAKDIANLQWCDVVGSDIMDAINPVASNYNGVVDSKPGAMIIKWRPAFGRYPYSNSSIDYGDEVRRISERFFNYYIQGWSASVPYEAPDLMMGALAVASMAVKIEEMKRAYGVMKYYSQLNSYLARGLVRALGYNFDSLQRDLANFRSRINLKIDEFNSNLACPKQLPILNRWLYITKHLFVDTGDAEFSPIIAYKPDAFLLFDHTTTMTTGSSLLWSKGASYMDGQSVDQAFDEYDGLYRGLNSDDMRSMFGSLRRVYSPEDFYHIEPLTEDYVAPLVRNDVVNAQLHNADWFNEGEVCCYVANNQLLKPTGGSGSNVILYQTPTGGMCSEVYVRVRKDTDVDEHKIANKYYTMKAAQTGALLDIYDHQISPESVLDISSSITPMYTADTLGTMGYPTSESFAYYALTPRCEVIVDVVTLVSSVHNEGSEVLKEVSTPMFLFSDNGDATLGDTDHTVANAKYALHIDSCPRIPLVNSATFEASGYLSEIDRYTVVEKRAYARMNLRSMWQLLKMPTNTKSITR